MHYIGFLRCTSYSAIFSEHQSHLDLDLGDWSKDFSSKDSFNAAAFDRTKA